MFKKKKETTKENEFSSSKYWEDRYVGGRNSGPGSYGRLAEFKAEVLNDFVEENEVKSVVEFGCGDGNQLSLARYPSYVGLDVSKEAVRTCAKKFKSDSTKEFYVLGTRKSNRILKSKKFDLSMSLDVIFHLVEDDVYEDYMNNLFSSASKFVIIYSSNHAFNSKSAPHVRHRNFTKYVEKEFGQRFQLIDTIKNKYQFDPDNPDNTSFADFYIYKKDM